MSAQTTSSSYLPLPGGGTLYSTGNAGGSRYYQHIDWLGTVRVESQLGARTVTFDRAFAPYGEMYDNFGVTTQQNFTGNTQDFDGSSALFDTPNRELHVTQGRWISPDPVEGSWNAYAYPTNPNLQTDPSGLCPSDPYCSAHPEVYAYQKIDPETGEVSYCDCRASSPGRTIPSDPNRDPGNSWGNMGTMAAQVMFDLGNPNWGMPARFRIPAAVTNLFNKYKVSRTLSSGGTSSSFPPDDPAEAANAAADVDIRMNIDANVRALAPAMRQGAAFANAATKYTGYAYVAAATTAVGGPTVANLVLRGVGWAQGTFGAGTGVLLGRYYNEVENYIVDANEMGANYFNLGNVGWKLGNYFGDAWVANQAFIDASVTRGQKIFLNQGPLGPEAIGTYGREIDYLFQSGVPNGQIMTQWF